jgi:hypothetical protein
MSLVWSQLLKEISSCPKYIEFIAKDHFVKHMSITSTHNYKLQLIQIGNYLQKISKVASLISLVGFL